MSLFSSKFTDTATYRAFEGMDDFGNSLFSKEIGFSCRFEANLKEVIDSKGNRVLSAGLIMTDLKVKPLSEIVYEGTAYTALSAIPVKGITGSVDHYEVRV